MLSLSSNNTIMPKVIGIGEILWDVLPEGKQLGGAPANFAYHASMAGMDATIVSAIGHDTLGDEALCLIAEKGLNGTFIARVNYPTGQVNVSLDEKGVPQYDICKDVAWDNIPFSDEISCLAAHCDAVCFGTLAQRNDVSRKTIWKFLDATPSQCLKILDVNLRQNYYSAEILRESLKRANLLKLNEEELPIVAGLMDVAISDEEQTCATLIEEFALSTLILTCGDKYSLALTREGQISRLDTPQVQVADTVGAGDSFTAAFAAAMLKGCSLKEAHRRAVETSAYVCTCHGAMPDYSEL